jgi:hypothetical protein
MPKTKKPHLTGGEILRAVTALIAEGKPFCQWTTTVLPPAIASKADKFGQKKAAEARHFTATTHNPVPASYMCGHLPRAQRRWHRPQKSAKPVSKHNA